MSDLGQIPSTIGGLVDDLLDGRSTEDGLRRLEHFLRGNLHSQRFFLDYCQLHIDLAIDFRADKALQSFRDRQRRIAPVALPTQRAADGGALVQKSQPFLPAFPRIISFGWVVAALLLLAFGGWMWWSAATRPVAQALPVPREDSGLKTQSLTSVQLDKAVTTLTLDRIGSVIIEGPADFKLTGPLRCRLNQGRIKVHVSEKSGQGFVVETPDGEVTDLGTEFGLEVADHQRSGLVVFKGSVDLRIANTHLAGGKQTVKRLQQGDGVLFAKGGSMSRVVSIITGEIPTFRQSQELAASGLHPLVAGIADNLRSTNSNKFYEIVPGGFHEGVLAYVDRETCEWIGLTEHGLPSYLNGADYVKPFNDDQQSSNINIAVSLDRPAKLYVFFDDRLLPPKWLKDDFHLTGDKIGMDDYNEEAPAKHSNTFSVWERIVAKPGTVILGPCQLSAQQGSNMYSIAAVPLMESLQHPALQLQRRGTEVAVGDEKRLRQCFNTGILNAILDGPRNCSGNPFYNLTAQQAADLPMLCGIRLTAFQSLFLEE